MTPNNRDKLQLKDFNNITKTLGFNSYNICYANTLEQQHKYNEYINTQYNTNRLIKILNEVANIIGARILNVAHQDYEPQGASVTALLSEQVKDFSSFSNTPIPGLIPNTIVTHLDKSHLTIHTYPETNPNNGINTFRADFDVSTCGQVSPLRALNYLINYFNSDIVTMDYRVRGFARDIDGHKLFIDHEINSIQDYIASENKRRYRLIDVNMYQENIFHTKMALDNFDVNNYLFDVDKDDLSDLEFRQIESSVECEMLELFHGRNYD